MAELMLTNTLYFKGSGTLAQGTLPLCIAFF